MYKYTCLNPIADIGLSNLTDKYERTDDFASADAVFVRSAKMDDLVPGANLLAIARAGAGVNNIPHAEYAKKGIVVDADRLSAACCALEQAGRAQDAAEATLMEAREAAHARLNELKELFNATKVPIKQGFAPEMWNVFGIMDKK